ncbi:hypothetical protein ATEIFO6365_0004001600 [Aspergillus terreus]|uniref:Uncharacterized protein n=1 Tax=Aspergillus terreus TaxID=33178 RepID=A0A5M3YNC5_ASPTE|nr:hypothetical protein ATETN484_0002011500 [Aspergillus terreus]GFF14898.1 hypothetical protein ATEIFO6365_0004001600 [Aspergillus terreus]
MPWLGSARSDEDFLSYATGCHSTRAWLPMSWYLSTKEAADEWERPPYRAAEFLCGYADALVIWHLLANPYLRTVTLAARHRAQQATLVMRLATVSS